jgi:hypothetical protein
MAEMKAAASIRFTPGTLASRSTPDPLLRAELMDVRVDSGQLGLDRLQRRQQGLDQSVQRSA